jgi:host factor-I protein
MYKQPVIRKSTGFFEDTDRKNPYSGGMDGKERDIGRSKTANLQEIFLNNCRKNENQVHVELVTGERRDGKIVGFDSQSIILATMDTQLLIYKSSVSVVIPETPVQYIFNELHRHEGYSTVGYEFLHAGTEETGNHA